MATQTGVTTHMVTPKLGVALDDAVIAPWLADRLAFLCTGHENQDLVDLLVLYHELGERHDPAAKEARHRVERIADRVPFPDALADVVFGKTNISSTIAATAGIAYARASRRRLLDVLELDQATKRRLISWANRPGVGIKSAKRHFPELRMARVDGQWVFELERKAIPAYVLKGEKVMEKVARVPIGRGVTLGEISRTAHLTEVGMDLTRVGGVLTHTAVGAGAALMPQMIFDAIDAGGINADFAKRQAYSQPANAAGFFAGIVAGRAATWAFVLIGGAAGSAAVPILVTGFLVGAVVQVGVGWYRPSAMDRTLAEVIGDAFTGQRTRPH